MHSEHTRSDQEPGAFNVGSDIRNDANNKRADRQALARAADPDTLDATDDPTVGDNRGVMGDADAMTTGDTGDQSFDDSAARPLGSGTMRRGEHEEIY